MQKLIPPKKPSVYYNESDKDKCAWLRELISRNVIAPGVVDERSITDVRLDDLRGFTQCHFFAGIGVWSYALRLAGWPDERPVWTGSCPCPSFSAAGKGGGFNDPRHLWPDWARLVRECKPATIFGEQADDAIGYGWIDLVQTDLERENYAVGKAVLGAASVGAPHIRQRLYFVANAPCERQPFGNGEQSGEFQGKARTEELRSGDALRELANTKRSGQLRIDQRNGEAFSQRSPMACGDDADGNESRWFGARPDGSASEAGYVNGFWRDADWILRKRWNRDDWEWCPTEPGTFPLAHGVAGRVLKLRGYGDAICAPLAAEFIQASSEALSFSPVISHQSLVTELFQ